VRAATSAHHARAFLAGSLPGIKVATIKMALLVMALQMDCGSGEALPIGVDVVIDSTPWR